MSTKTQSRSVPTKGYAADVERKNYVITRFEGYWHMELPPTSWLAELLGDTIFRTGFEAEVPEETVREFYIKRLNVRPDEIVIAA